MRSRGARFNGIANRSEFKLRHYRLLSMSDLAEMIDVALPKPGKRGGV